MPIETNHWSAAEIEATVDAYATLFDYQAAGKPFSKSAAYKALADAWGRSPSAYDYRFRNISHVLLQTGLPTLSGATAAYHVGPTATGHIRQVVQKRGYFGGSAAPIANSVLLEQRTLALVHRGVKHRPLGIERPMREPTVVEQFVRDPAVKAWVLEQAEGRCENCGQPTPFVREDGTPFLEVHHVKWLSEGGSDTVTNAVAVCPNCHRKFHYGVNAAQLVIDIIAAVERLDAVMDL